MTKIGVCRRSARSKAGAPNLEGLGRVFGEQQHVLGVAVRGIGAGAESHCWVRVGMPVEGPARCTSNITAGISAK